MGDLEVTVAEVAAKVRQHKAKASFSQRKPGVGGSLRGSYEDFNQDVFEDIGHLSCRNLLNTVFLSDVRRVHIFGRFPCACC